MQAVLAWVWAEENNCDTDYYWEQLTRFWMQQFEHYLDTNK